MSETGIADQPNGNNWSASHLLFDNGKTEELLLPIKATDRIKYTCLALSKRFIAFGATSGALYIFQRETNKYLQVLVNKEGPVSHVAFAPDDNLVGLSTNNGFVVIWQLNIANRKKPDLLITSFAHKGSCITCLKWNDTSQRLYSGDVKGKVTVTNAFSRKVSGLLQLPTSPIVTLDSAIVQLDFTKDYLLVSSLSKCHICNTKRQQFYSVGKKLRDGLYGACFYLKSKESDTVIYSARPGSRLWEANLKGEVVATHQFKKQLAIPALPIISTDDEQFLDAEDNQPPQAINFPFLMRLEHFLLSWNEKAIYILDTSTGKVVLWTRPPSGIQNLCVYKSDIYYIDSESQINKLSLLTIERCIVRLFIKKSWKMCASICHHFADILTSIKTKRLVSINILKDIQQHLSKQENTKDLIGYLDDVIYKMEQIITEETNSSSSSRRSSIESVDSVRLESGIYLIRSRRGSRESLEDLLSSPANHFNENENNDAMKQEEQFNAIECSTSESDVNVANNNEQRSPALKESNADDINGDILGEQEVVQSSIKHRDCQSNGLDCETDFKEESLKNQIFVSDSAGEVKESELQTSHPAWNALEVNELHTQVEGTVTHKGTDCEVNSPDVEIDTDCQESATQGINGGCVEDEITTKDIEKGDIQLECPELAQNQNTLIENSITSITMVEKQPVDVTTIVAEDKMSCDDDVTNPVVVFTPSVTEEAGVVDHELILEYHKLEETDSFADSAYEPVMRRTESFTCPNSNEDRTVMRRSYSMSNAVMQTGVPSSPKPSKKQSRHQNGKKKKKKSRVPEIGEVKPKKDIHKENIDRNQTSDGHILKPRPKDIIIPDKSPSVSKSPSPLFGKRFGLESPIFSRRSSPSPIDDVTSERKGLGQRQISVPFAAVKDSLSSTYSKTKEFVKAKLDQNKKSPNIEESGLILPVQLPSEEKQNELLYASEIVVKACDAHQTYSPFEEATISTRLKLQHPLILYDVSMCQEVLDQWLTDLQAAYEKNSELKTGDNIVVKDNQPISDENENLDDQVTDSEKVSDDMKENPSSQIESGLDGEDSSSISEELCEMADNFPLQDSLHDHASELLMMCFEMQVFPASRQPDINESNNTPMTSFDGDLSMQFCESNKETGRTETSVQYSEYSVPIIDGKILDMQAASFVKQFFHFLDVNRIRKVMSSWTGCRQKTYNMLSRKLIDYFNGNRATSCQNTSCAAKMIQMQEQYKDVYRMLRLVIDSPDACVESLVESKADLRVWEIKEILQIFSPAKGQKLFGDYVGSRMQQESLSDRCNFTAELCDDSNVFNYLIQCIFNCNAKTTKMAICTCGSPRPGYSCSQILTRVYHEWASIIDVNHPPNVHAIFLDWSKAFDKVPHATLLSKLKSKGIAGQIHMWICDFLLHRTQSVIFRGECSLPVSVQSGVPQGSILGPLLFILFTSDLQNVISSRSSIFMYADDTVIFRPISSDEDAIKLQSDLNNIAAWSHENGMVINPSKLVFLPISRRQNPLQFAYKVNHIEIPSQSEHSYLGVIIQSNLKWHLHIQSICNKANRVLGFIKRFTGRSKLSLTMYNSLCLPILEYASPVWNPYMECDIVRIERIQRDFTRYYLGQNSCLRIGDTGYLSYDDRMANLGFVTLKQRRKVIDLCFFFKLFNSPIINMFDFILNIRKEYPTLCNRNPRCNELAHSFCHRIIVCWNCLPLSVRNGNFNLFKKYVKESTI